MKKIRKVLIANRGEIALRVIRTCKDMGIKTVAIYSDADRHSLPVRWADEAFRVGPAASNQSYLVMDKIFEVARESGADAIHPGYGFLSENAAFSDRCTKEGLIFIGPKGDSMRALGDKIAARTAAEKLKVPTVPGITRPLKDDVEALTVAEKIGYPVLLKARSGGGGKGMRRVDEGSQMKSAFTMAASEAKNSFSDDALYMEKYVEEPHHIEIQIFGDSHGNVIALGERECSVQRRHQKIVEESPSPYVSAATREKLMSAAVTLAREAHYEGAGTMEFLVDKHQNYYFLEMNARLQVEHPVTEEVTQLDLVRLQLEVAQGGDLKKIFPTFPQVPVTGHAIECRICAEDSDRDFMPSPGVIRYLRNPEGPGVRVDGALFSGGEISVYYDPMIAKLICWGKTRQEAIERTLRALGEYRIVGVKTNVAFHQGIMAHPDFAQGRYDTSFIAQHKKTILENIHHGAEEIVAYVAAFLENRKKQRVKITAPQAGNAAVATPSAWRRAVMGRKL